MKIRYVVFVFVLSIVLTNCKTKKENNDSAYTPFIFPKTYHCSNKDSIPLNILEPIGILASDSLLIIPIKTTSSDKSLKIFRRDNFKFIGGLLTKGRGPDEINFLMPIIQWDFSNGNTKLLIRSYPYFLSWLDLDKSLELNKPVFTKSYDFKSDYNKKMRMLESGFIYDLKDFLLISMYPQSPGYLKDNPNPYYIRYDYDKSLVIDSVYFQNFIRTDNFNSLIYAGNISLSPDLKYLAKAFAYLNTVDIFDLKTGSKKSLLFSKDANDFAYATNNPVYHLGDLKPTKDFLFIMSEKDDSATNGIITKIYTFKWDGTPIAQLNFSENIFTFFVDQNAGEIFAIDSDRKFWKYTLEKDLLK